MTTPSPQPVRPPGDRPLRGAVRLGIAAQLVLLPASLRHYLLWGGEWAEWLHGLELLSVVLGVGLGALAAWRAMTAGERGDASPADLVRGATWVALFAVPVLPLLSEDVLSYYVRGRVLGVHGANPYTRLPSAFADVDPSVAVVKGWADFPLPYGPAMAVLQALVARLAETVALGSWRVALVAGVVLFKLIQVAALWGIGRVLLALLAGAARPTQARALGLCLWNPFVLLEGVVNAHNDLLMLLPMLLALREAGRARHGRATFWLLMAAQVKFVTLALLPPFLVLAWRRRSLGTGVLGCLAGGALFVVGGALFWREPGSLGFLARQTALAGVSLQDVVMLGLGEAARPTVKLAALGIAATVSLLLAWRVRTVADLPAMGVATFQVVILVGLPFACIWYSLWWGMLAPLAGGAAVRGFLAASAGGTLGYAPYLLTRSFAPWVQWFGWISALAMPGLVWMAAGLCKRDAAP